MINRGKIGNRVISTVKMGIYHTLLQTSDGILFSWGSNAGGQCGIGAATNPVTSISLVQITGALIGKTIADFSPGVQHSMLYTGFSDNNIYVWGRLLNGNQVYIGPGDGTTSVRYAPVVTSPMFSSLGAGKLVLAIRSGYYNAVVLLTDGTVYMTGDQTYGQVS